MDGVITIDLVLMKLLWKVARCSAQRSAVPAISSVKITTAPRIGFGNRASPEFNGIPGDAGCVKGYMAHPNRTFEHKDPVAITRRESSRFCTPNLAGCVWLPDGDADVMA
jgi:hypothetical protein